MKLVVVGPTYKIDKDVLQRVAKAAFSYLKVQNQPGEIELKMVSLAVIKKYNKMYRNIDKPTDVLSFNLSEEPLAGQIVICYNYTVKQAKSLKKDALDEFSLLVVHGILHLLGYDHIDQATTKEMQLVETEILKMEGISR